MPWLLTSPSIISSAGSYGNCKLIRHGLFLQNGYSVTLARLKSKDAHIPDCQISNLIQQNLIANIYFRSREFLYNH